MNRGAVARGRSWACKPTVVALLGRVHVRRGLVVTRERGRMQWTEGTTPPSEVLIGVARPKKKY